MATVQATKVVKLDLHQDEYEGTPEGAAAKEAARCRGALVHVHANGSSGWRPFPWNHVPDRVCVAIALAVLLPCAPPMAVLIGCAVLFWELCRLLYKPLGGAYWQQLRDRVSQAVADRIMREPRNAPYLPYMAFVGVWAPALLAWAYSRHTTYGFEWWLFIAYNVLRIGPRFRFFAHVHVLVHKEGHDKKGFFKGPFRVLNYFNQWFLGPFYGQVPMSYETGHMKIHHRYDNGLDDLHTNLDLDRSDPYSLLVYFPRFSGYWSGVSCACVFMSKREWVLAAKMWSGVLAYHGVLAGLLWWDWKFALPYCIYPYIEATIFFSLISYLWHAWMDPTDPSNHYVNSVTILNGHDNIWNEDYHVVHHVSQCHWTENPAHYEKNKAKYAAHHATIFEDCEEGLLLGWMLTKNWDEMARHFVDLNGKMTHEEKKALILSRLKPTLSRATEDTKKGA